MRITAIFLLFFTAAAALAQKDPVSRSWNQPVEPFRIAGNLYYVGASDVTSYLLTSPNGHIVIDGGFAETAPMILANIRKLGFEPKDVKILLSSHAHLDHAGGLAELARATGAKFYASAGDVPLHARGGLDDPNFGNELQYPPIVADRVLRDGEQVKLGGTTLVAHVRRVTRRAARPGRRASARRTMIWTPSSFAAPRRRDTSSSGMRAIRTSSRTTAARSAFCARCRSTSFSPRTGTSSTCRRRGRRATLWTRPVTGPILTGRRRRSRNSSRSNRSETAESRGRRARFAQ